VASELENAGKKKTILRDPISLGALRFAVLVFVKSPEVVTGSDIAFDAETAPGGTNLGHRDIVPPMACSASKHIGGISQRRTRKIVTPVYPAKPCPLSVPVASTWLRFVYSVEPFIAAAGLVLLAPVTLTIALSIATLSRRSPLVSHTRVGWRGTPLPMLKFRTMWEAGEPPESSRDGWLLVEDVSDRFVPGKAPAVENTVDPRVTSRFAAFCRRFSLDELPQLYHVARGEMSLVGPRPITLAELDTWYGECANEVISLRPGMTGLWQVMGRNALTYEQRKQLDLVLVREASPSLYFSILLRSIPKVLTGAGAG
jgi:exopolysaccharide production protein ExoY